MSRIRNAAARFAYVPQTWRMVWTAAHRWTLAWMVLLAAQGLLPAATVYLTRQLVEALAAGIGSGITWHDARPILTPAALMAIVMLLSEALQAASDWVRTAQSELVQDYLSGLIHEKSVTVDMAFYESPDYYDRLYRARNELTSRPLALLESTGSLLQNGITLVAMAAVLLPYGIWLPFLLLASTLPAFYVVLRFNRRTHRWWEETTADRRWLQYHDTMLTHAAVAAEIRLFNLGDHFRSAFQALRRRLRGERLQLSRMQGLAQLGAGVAASLMAGVAVAWMGWRTLQGTATLGDLALFYQALTRGQNLLRSLLGNLGQIYNSSLFLGNLFEFLGLQPRIADAPNPVPAPSDLQTGISFRNVTFRYPAS
ncbi:MAG: ABC transporter ATP-binding protein, partial [Solirubrobacterales bacterium]|nr:ABC transporter ATP-binding protein [Solirubrobacterales bacterium]